jgi:hypothetical protein
LAAVDKNDEQYKDVFTHSLIIQGSDVEYGVQAYNDEGKSDIDEEHIDYCP